MKIIFEEKDLTVAGITQNGVDTGKADSKRIKKNCLI